MRIKRVGKVPPQPVVDVEKAADKRSGLFYSIVLREYYRPKIGNRLVATRQNLALHRFHVNLEKIEPGQVVAVERPDLHGLAVAGPKRYAGKIGALPIICLWD